MKDIRTRVLSAINEYRRKGGDPNDAVLYMSEDAWDSIVRDEMQYSSRRDDIIHGRKFLGMPVEFIDSDEIKIGKRMASNPTVQAGSFAGVEPWMKEIILKRVRYAMRNRIQVPELQHVRVDMIKESLEARVDDVTISLCAEVWKEDSGQFEYDVPATWWDHFKRDWLLPRAPEWLKPKIKVNMLRHAVDVARLYPQLNVADHAGLAVMKMYKLEATPFLMPRPQPAPAPSDAPPEVP